MGLFDILKSVIGTALNSNSTNLGNEVGKKVIENRYKAHGFTNNEINEVQNVFTSGNKGAINQDVMIAESLKKQGYSDEEIKEFMAKLKSPQVTIQNLPK